MNRFKKMHYLALFLLIRDYFNSLLINNNDKKYNYLIE